MIELRNINKSFGTLHVLKDVNLRIEENEIITILGPSGAGKTTLLQIAGSLDRPDSGDVIYDGTGLYMMKDKKLSEFRNRHIGFIFQNHRLLPEFTAQENVAMPALIAGMHRSEAMRRAAELLTRLGIAERAGHKPAEMSGGECQRTAIARSLMNDPKVIFADEPTGSLDSRNRDDIRSLIAELCTETCKTFVIVTHDPSMNSIAHRIVNMADGRIISETHPVVHPASPSAETLPAAEQDPPSAIC